MARHVLYETSSGNNLISQWIDGPTQPVAPPGFAYVTDPVDANILSSPIKYVNDRERFRYNSGNNKVILRNDTSDILLVTVIDRIPRTSNPTMIWFEIVTEDVVASGTCEATGTVSLFPLDAADVAADGVYDRRLCRVTAGTGIGESFFIKTHAGGDLVPTEDLNFTPDTSTEYEIIYGVDTSFGAKREVCVVQQSGDEEILELDFTAGQLSDNTIWPNGGHEFVPWNTKPNKPNRNYRLVGELTFTVLTPIPRV